MLIEARILATTDPLTGAYNRRHFFESLETELARAYSYSTPLAVIMFDIDDFKQFNDKYGHSVDDEILIMLTKTCQAHLRNFDSLCRYGGDEFVILFPQTNSTLAVNVANRLCQYVFPVDDPKWDKLIPNSIPSKHRRTTVTCYSWPGVHPEACMAHYAQQLEPFIEVLFEKGYDGLSLEGTYFERALYRATLKAWLDEEAEDAFPSLLA